MRFFFRVFLEGLELFVVNVFFCNGGLLVFFKFSFKVRWILFMFAGYYREGYILKFLLCVLGGGRGFRRSEVEFDFGFGRVFGVADFGILRSRFVFKLSFGFIYTFGVVVVCVFFLKSVWFFRGIWFLFLWMLFWKSK